jgi:hypothetical protein
MKMSQADYDNLKNDIRTVCSAYGVNLATAEGGKTGLLSMHSAHAIVDRNRTYDDSHPGFAEGMWKRVLPSTGRAFCHLYDKGLDDTHIATALRKIKAELIAETL